METSTSVFDFGGIGMNTCRCAGWRDRDEHVSLYGMALGWIPGENNIQGLEISKGNVLHWRSHLQTF